MRAKSAFKPGCNGTWNDAGLKAFWIKLCHMWGIKCVTPNGFEAVDVGGFLSGIARQILMGRELGRIDED